MQWWIHQVKVERDSAASSSHLPVRCSIIHLCCHFLFMIISVIQTTTDQLLSVDIICKLRFYGTSYESYYAFFKVHTLIFKHFFSNDALR